MLRLHGVGKRYGRGRAVLDGLDLEVEAGQVLGVVGTNGCGKSTLLRILAGVSRPTEGVRAGSPSLGYVPDRFPAATRMSALGYLRHLGRISGLSTVDERAVALLERLALEGGPKAPIRRLSKGNAQKVALAQALLGDPELLVLDEPWSGLDPAAHGVLGELIAETRERGAAVVFTAHREDVAHDHASRVFRLTEGKLRAVEASDEHGPCARIRLRGPGSGDWSGEPGLFGITVNGEHLDLTVAAGRSDAILLTALRRGWSVVAVDTPVAK
ncbi:ABC transporter ATP-binding protein [Amycolatopsis acidicola]|uniref:ABC transporter ATP-binding protein n=1 Tax=Amycolatopsis acidicola TaxID=2596893 RepID=A0A5N0VNX6_9PSEU|nr:ABC transporter ATP-binding protein [Amycolatopsis acidicola]KAA9166920.1 ABC transporter ATP-binding protein [Amycolatopsis acidicola]